MAKVRKLIEMAIKNYLEDILIHFQIWLLLDLILKTEYNEK